MRKYVYDVFIMFRNGRERFLCACLSRRQAYNIKAMYCIYYGKKFKIIVRKDTL